MKVKVRDKIGTDNYEDYFDIEIRRVGFKPAKRLPDFSSYYGESLPKNTYFDDWGIPFVTGSEGHVKRELYPMAAFKAKEEVLEYPWPDFMSSYRHEHLEKEVRKLHDRGYPVIGRLTETSGGSIFETAWQLREMDNLFVDFYDNPDFGRVLLDKITEINVQVSTRFAEAGVDVLWLADDIATQKTMLMSPAMWRKWLKPRLKHLIEKVGQGGGFVIAPTHFVPAEVPWENVQAFFDAVEEFGRYQ